MAKQYTTDELIKAWREGERGEFKCKGNLCDNIQLIENGIIFKESRSSYYISPVDEKIVWTKVQEPVDFMTAINSGKRIAPVRTY